jgi:uncharacterized membrane protein
MSKIIVAFVALFIVLYTSIDIFRRLTGKERMQFVALAGYSLAIAAVTTAVAMAIVFLF